MALQLIGPSGFVAEVDNAQKALRTSFRPLDHGSLGVYRLSAQTGVMAAALAANSEIFQFRWTDATRFVVIERVMFDGLGSIVGFAAGSVILRLTVARAWTVDGSGGTAQALTTNNSKLRTSHATSLTSTAGSIRIASTAALTAGTKTLDGTDIGGVVGSVTATAGASVAGQSCMDVMGAGHPLVLAANEGFVIRASVPATGTWTGGVTIHWTEMAAY